MPRHDKEDHFDEYVKYVQNSRGVPDEYETWAQDNGIKLPPKKRKRQDIDDDDYTE